MEHRTGKLPWLLVLGLSVGCGDGPGKAAGKGDSSIGVSKTDAKPAESSGRIVFITNSDSTFWDAAEKGANDAGRSLGVGVAFLRNKSADAAGQIKLIEQASAQRDVKAVCVSVVNASAIGIIDQLKSLKAKGVAVVTFDSDTGPKDRDARSAYVGTNNFEAGKAAGKIAQSLLPNGGKVVAFRRR